MAEIREIYDKFVGTYENNLYCRQDSLGSAREFAAQKYFLRNTVSI